MGLFFCLLCGLMFLSGCDAKLEQNIWDNVAEYRQFVVFGDNDNMSVTFMCGKREVDYKSDGVATDLIPFGVITITLDRNIPIDTMNYVLYVGTEKYTGDLQQNPFDKTLVADIGKIVDQTQNISIDVILNGEKYSLKLNRIDNDWVVSMHDCVKIFVDKYKEDIKSFVNKNVFEGEVYLKIIDDYDKHKSDFYFYISFISRQGSSISMLISPKTGEILASKCKLI